MRIFVSFMILVGSVLLILLPVTEGVYDYRTDIRGDIFQTTTALGCDNATVQLFKSIYDDDVSTLSFSSDNTADDPAYLSYNSTSRAVVITGLADNATRALTASYDYLAVTGIAQNKFLDIIPWFWVFLWIAFPAASIVAIFTGRAGI